MNNISGWMSEEELNWLHNTAKKMSCVVEIGSWKGRSTYALLTGCKGHVRAVDHFKGNKGVKEMEDEVKGENIYQEFLKNVGNFSNLIIERGNSLEIADKYKGWTFDMIFLDGSHGYDDVKKDIEAWLPKTKKLICGHDYDFPEVKKAVDELIGSVNLVGSIWYKYI